MGLGTGRFDWEVWRLGSGDRRRWVGWWLEQDLVCGPRGPKGHQPPCCLPKSLEALSRRPALGLQRLDASWRSGRMAEETRVSGERKKERTVEMRPAVSSRRSGSTWMTLNGKWG